MRRIALIMESQTRQNQPMPAHLFYRSPKSRWINAVIDYMEARDFPREDAFFVSVVSRKIFGFDEIVYPYPKSEYHPRKKDCALFAQEILAFLQQFQEPIFVELHMSLTLANELKVLFQEHGIDYLIYGEGQSLAAKPVYYQRLIEEELEIRKVKLIKREKWALVAGIKKRTPTEAQRLLDEYGHKRYLFSPEVEAALEGLKQLLKKHYERRKAEKEAFEEFIATLEKEQNAERFEEFFQRVNLLHELFAKGEEYEMLKSQFGRTMSKFERFLIKREYALEIENKISAALLRIQILLM